MANILIIDDSAFSRSKLKKVLEAANHTIVGEAEDGVEGLEKYKELSPDLVTLDVTMPKVNGLECLENILTYDNEAKVVMISALGKGDTILKALDAGASSYITKPYEDTQILEAIADALTED